VTGAVPIVAAKGPVIPSFGQGGSCVTGNHTFCWGWVRDNWHSVLGPALVQHLELTAIAVGIGFVLSAALALVAHYRRGLEQPFGIVSALLYTIPSLALFQLLIPFTGLTWTTVEIALVAYTLVILFPNFVAGLQSAPPDVIEAARGMGLTRKQILLRVELPLALPAVMAGLRVAIVSTIAIATIAAFLLPDGLGYPIFLALKDPTPFKTEIYAAGALAVALALACDALCVALRRVLVPWARKGVA
jgi:osmoprotectant transport system permease protein